MPLFHVKVRDKRTKQEMTLPYGHPTCTPEEAKKYIESMPTSHGGTHPGLEVIEVEEVKPDAPAVAVVAEGH